MMEGLIAFIAGAAITAYGSWIGYKIGYKRGHDDAYPDAYQALEERIKGMKVTQSRLDQMIGRIGAKK